MSKLVLVRDEKFRDHLTPEMHPESPKRLVAIDQALKASQLDQQLDQAVPRPATEDELGAVHGAGYIDNLIHQGQKAKQQSKVVALDESTWMSGDTYDVAKLAAGGGLIGVDAISGTHSCSFVAVRPPGHHALANQAMGFCLFNNLAVAARYAQKKLGIERIMVIDWDVHHGNGTQDLFYSDPSVCFLSLHQYPLWPPNSGWLTQDGEGEGQGYNINIPLPAGTGDAGYLKAWDTIVKPICLEYKPELIMVSAGYDAHQSDPLSQQNVSTAGYALLSQRLSELALATNAKLICFLEGGYNTKALSESVLATIGVLNLDSPNQATSNVLVSGGTEDLRAVTMDKQPLLVDERIEEVRQHFCKYWSSLR